MISIPKIVIKYVLNNYYYYWIIQILKKKNMKNATKNNKKVKYKIVEDQKALNFPATQKIDRIQREEKTKLATTEAKILEGD